MARRVNRQEMHTAVAVAEEVDSPVEQEAPEVVQSSPESSVESTPESSVEPFTELIELCETVKELDGFEAILIAQEKVREVSTKLADITKNPVWLGIGIEHKARAGKTEGVVTASHIKAESARLEGDIQAEELLQKRYTLDLRIAKLKGVDLQETMTRLGDSENRVMALKEKLSDFLENSTREKDPDYIVWMKKRGLAKKNFLQSFTNLFSSVEFSDLILGYETKVIEDLEGDALDPSSKIAQSVLNYTLREEVEDVIRTEFKAN